MFPQSIQRNIQSLLEDGGSRSSLISARTALTKRYRSVDQGNKSGFLSSKEAIAYMATRMPATFAAVEAILAQVPSENITSVLDLGSGPGTAALAVALRWPSCQKLHLVEGDAFMEELSKEILKDIPEIQKQAFSFEHANLLTYTIKETYDLVILSYVLTELSPKHQELVLERAWEKAVTGLVIVVPGTPDGYQTLMGVRDLLIHLGAFIAAPCPHHHACPLLQGDWCHFSTRLSRASYHKEIKDASLSYEDEKYSYLIAMREPCSRANGRVIRKPLKRSGHVLLDLCTTDGLKRQTYSKRDKKNYKVATQVSWGDSWGIH